MSELTHLSAAEIARGVRDGSLNAIDITEACLAKIASHNGDLNALLHIDNEGALAAAKAAMAGDRKGALAGVPVIIKDNIQVAGLPLTCASKLLGNYRSSYDATVVARLRAAGAVILGKANMDEFAMGSSCEYSAFGPTKNPWDQSKVPGGSSGGSAASVAAGFAPVALGSDTGGSIRQPAAFCGNIGFKPTYGRVSRFGLVAFGSSMDQIGPFTRSLEDSRLVSGVIGGFDGNDATSLRESADLGPNEVDLSTLRVGFAPAHLGAGCQPAVKAAIEAQLAMLKDQGATIVELDMPMSEYVVQVYYILATSEASANLSRFDGVRYGHRTEIPNADILELYQASRGEGFGDEVKRRIMLGTFALSAGYQDAYFKRAMKVRKLITQEFDGAFAKCDVILGPTAPSVAFGIGEVCDDPLTMYLNDVYTIGANLSGHPALSMPCGYSEAGLPIGLHLQTATGSDGLLFDIADSIDETMSVEERQPSL